MTFWWYFKVRFEGKPASAVIHSFSKKINWVFFLLSPANITSESWWYILFICLHLIKCLNICNGIILPLSFSIMVVDFVSYESFAFDNVTPNCFFLRRSFGGTIKRDRLLLTLFKLKTTQHIIGHSVKNKNITIEVLRAK